MTITKQRVIQLRQQLENIRLSARDNLKSITSISELHEVRVKFLGKKGELTAVLKQMGSLSENERPIIGQIANEVRCDIEKAIEQSEKKIKAFETEQRLQAEKIDVTLPCTHHKLGHRHPLSIVLDEVKEIFFGMGFSIATGPEVELDYYNFEALNMPKDHPARDTQDTFYINENTVLRTQTSPVQIRVMESQSPPIRIIAPGRVYRSDAVDATHSPLFHQIEGLVVDKGITMGDLKGTLELFAKRLYGDDTKIRFRPHHFQFTEPSCEIDVSCFRCGGNGCPMCKGEGFIEILGGGMVHPKVLQMSGVDPEVYSGFAFGVGLERITMFRFNIDDMRLLFENDIRFLSQF
jgi:phenylalanyl-tRNA synthetase alpha chain